MTQPFMFEPLFRAHPDWIRQGISHLLHIFDSARKADKTLVASAVQRHVTALDFAAETWLCFRCRVLGQIFNGSEVDLLICPVVCIYLSRMVNQKQTKNIL